MGTAMAERVERELEAYRQFDGPPGMPNKPTLRPDEVARILGCSRKHAWHLVQEGSLKEAVDVRSAICHKPSIRLTARSLVEFCKRRRV